MKMTLELLVEATFFQTEQAEKAEASAQQTGGKVYSWKTTGRHNWLEEGYSRVDVLGLVVIPTVLPDTVRMLDDEFEGD
jgi:hypothetical protein